MPRDLEPDRDPNLMTPGPLARYPLVGFALALIGLLVFGWLAYDLFSHGPLTTQDAAVVQAIHVQAVHGSPLIVLAMRASGFLGEYMVVLLALILGILWLRRRAWRPFRLLVLGVAGGEVLFQFLSLGIGRPRPHFPDPLEALPVPGFPSGHTISSVLLYGLLIYLFLPRVASRAWRVVIVLLGLLLIAWIAFGRVYLGSHYPTDVIAGAAVGLNWGGAVYTAIEMDWQRRLARGQAAAAPGGRSTS